MEKVEKIGDGRFYDELYHHHPEERREARERAEAEPAFDYFEVIRPSKPKEAVGRYVESHGFNVPLLEEGLELKDILADGRPMLRSELAQDYNGLSGLFSSIEITPDWKDIPELAGQFYTTYNGSHPEFIDRLYSLMRSSLERGELSLEGFMNLLAWNRDEAALHEISAVYGSWFYFIDPQDRRVSVWHFIEGTNVRIFGDPNVEGRYHLGVESTGGYDSAYPGPGYYRVEAGEHDQPQEFRKHRQPFIASGCIEVYEAIRRLPFFDATIAPVMELQIDEAGEIHFLQYLKTKLQVDYVEAFELPQPAGETLFNNVRGITAEEGLETKLFFPNHGHMRTPGFIDSMEGRAVVYDPDALDLMFGKWLSQLLADKVSMLLHLAYVSFQDNHFDSAPVYRPPLAIGWANMGPDQDLPVNERLLVSLMGRRPELEYALTGSRLPQTIHYADIKVTSNGRHAVIESDWELKTASLKDL